MACGSNIYNFLAYAKICSANLSYSYVKAVNYGECGEAILGKVLLLKTYIREIEDYIYPGCKDFYLDGIKNFQGRKIVMSRNNSLYLTSKEGKVNIESKDLNCLTEGDICELASRIKKICINC